MKKLFLSLFALSVLSLCGHAADSAGVTAAKAEVSKGDYRKALELFADAARKDPADATAKGAYVYLKNILSQQESFVHETDAARKQTLGLALRNFYYAVGNVAKAQEIDAAVYAAAPTADNAVRLASTLLALDRHQDAETVLTKVSPATPAVELLTAIVAARQDNLDRNRALVAKNPFKELKTPLDRLLYARAVAAAGDRSAAIDVLKQIFTNTEPKKLPTVKKFVAQNPDFRKIAASAEFKQVLETKSAIKGCDGDCSKCPKRPKDKAECNDCEKEKQQQAATGK